MAFLAFSSDVAYEVEPSDFVSPYSGEEVAAIVAEYRGAVFNGTAVRLAGISCDGIDARICEGVEASTCGNGNDNGNDNGNAPADSFAWAPDGRECKNVCLRLQPSSFYDLLSTNLVLGANADAWSERSRALALRVKRLAERDGLEADPFSILSCGYLANNLAVSVLVECAGTGELLVTKRSSKVAISPGRRGVSVTGGLDCDDLRQPDPVRSCVQREALEELGLHVPLESIRLRGLFIGEKKLQPVVLCDVRLPLAGLRIANFETSELELVARNKLESYLAEPMTEAARFHLGLHSDTASA